MEALLEQTARRAEAARSAAWPDRVVEAEGFLDDEGFEDTPPVRVHARLVGRRRRAGGRPLRRGRADALRHERADRQRARRRLLRRARLPRREVPQNAGLTSRVRVVAPEGSLFDPDFPAALSARHLAVQRLSDV